jgi:SAM-dependent methyltransferase
MDNGYDNPATVKDWVRRGKHRELIGGLWDEIGQLQLDFLVSNGLLPHHRLLDIGCGPFRQGVKLIPYLDPGRYWGIDKNELLLQVGWDLEIKRYGLASRQPREQLICLDDFQFSRLDVRFDYAIALSVFTHFSLNRIRRCLTRLAPCMLDGGRLYATFFEVPPGRDRQDEIRHRPGGAASHSDRHFYHYDMDDFAFVTRDLPLRVERIGAWGHPRGQNMLMITKT